MDYYEIGQRIRRFRKARGFSQEELAEKVDISVTHMSHIETGNTKLSLPVFIALSNALEVRTDELLSDHHLKARNAAIEAIIHTLETCSTQQIRIIEDILPAIKTALNKYG